MSIKPMSIKNLLAAFILLAPSLLLTSPAIGQESTGYVSDVFYVPVHSGKSTRHRIVHRGIKSGTPFTVLETDSEAGFTKIRTTGGTEGWIQNQYVSNRPIARILLKDERKQRIALQEKFSELRSKNSSVNQSYDDVKQQLQSLSRNNQTLTSELASIKKISSNAINLDINNRELLQKNEILKVEIAELQAENARLSDKSNKDWFIRGALAVAIGALLAVILPKFKPKPKSSEWG